MKFLIVVIFLIIAYYALREPRKSSDTKVQNNATESKSAAKESFESSFEEGLPSDYIPSENAHYSDLQKLKEDYDYRWTKLHRHFEEEKKDLRDSDGYSKEKMDELIGKQELAKEEYQKRFKKMKAEFLQRLEEEKSSRDKGLR